MSVFQLEEWWSIKVGQDGAVSSGGAGGGMDGREQPRGEEEFDAGCMCLGNMDNASPPSEKIVVASLQGIIRIYHPTKAGFSVEDLIHEENTGRPILQVLSGRFIPSSPNMQALAVLHPRSLVVYELVATMSASGRVNYYTLTKLYEHRLGEEGKHFTAFNMTSGPFGSISGRDMIMVQSLDGKLQVFEQSAEAFSRQLVDALVPGPLAYLPKLDAFITANYSARLECYRYQVLVNAQSDIGGLDTSAMSGQAPRGSITGAKAGGASVTAQRGAMAEWTLNIGEQSRQIINGKFTQTDAKKSGDELLILTDRSLFLVKDTGAVIQQRRLEQDPSCIYSFPSGMVGQGHNFLLASYDQMLQVYCDFNLSWACKLRSVPVQMAVSTFGQNNRGMIVTIDDRGVLTIGYLGTRPPISAMPGAPVASGRALDYSRIDEEHKQLLQVIRDHQSERTKAPTEFLNIRVQMAKNLDTSAAQTEVPPDVALSGPGSDSPVKIVLRLYLSYSGSNKAITNVSFSVTGPAFITAMPSNTFIAEVSGVQSTPVIAYLTLFANRSFLATGLDIAISGTYTGAQGEPRVIHQALRVPLALACRVRPAVKNATHKLTLETPNVSEAQSLLELFSDFLYAQQSIGIDPDDVLGPSGAMALGFEFWTKEGALGFMPASSNPVVVSVIASKSGGRYRVQSDSFAAMSLIVRELEVRLQAKLSGGAATNNAPRQVTLAEPLVLEAFFNELRAHYALRTEITERLSRLNDVSHQFRMIEKRLLARFRDRNPAPLGGLDSMLRESYNEIIKLADDVQMSQSHQRRQRETLDASVSLVTALAAMKYSLDADNAALLRYHLASEYQESTEQGWEDTVEASVTYLLKTSLAKTAKDSAAMNPQMESVEDVEKVIKHIMIVFDRLGKGAVLTSAKS